MAKLRNDEIRWILSVDAQGAQAEVQKFASSIDRLKKENKELAEFTNQAKESLKKQKEELRELAQQGKKNSAEYQQLSKEIARTKDDIDDNTKAVAANNKAIDEQNKKLGEYIKTMKVEDMTMSQLRKRAKELQSQLDRTSKSLSPESYAKLEKELNGVRERMKALNSTAVSFSETMRGGLMVLAGNLMTKAIGYLKQLVDTAKKFVSEGIEMAASADGVLRAFKRLNAPGLLSNLRKSTKDTVNDFELMKTAVQAKDFRIPLEDLGKYLEFAQMKAQDLGKSVEYMTESIITGLGRRSVKILDNLGITSAEISENMKKTGDFASAVAAIVDKQLSSAGDKYVSSADRIQQRTVRLENAKLKLGQRVLWIKEAYDDLSSSMAQSLINTLTTATEKYEDQTKKVVQLETEMPELLRRYDELSSKSELSKKEQDELRSVMEQIKDMVPGVVTAWDSYGNAISISTEKVEDFIRSQKVLLEHQNRDAIKEQTKNLEKYRKELETLKTINEEGGSIRFTPGGSFGGSNDYFYQYTEEELAKVQEDIKKYGELIKDTEILLDEFQGKRIESYVNESKERKKFTAMTKSELDAWIKDEKNAASEYLKIAKEVYEFRFGQTTEPVVDEAASKKVLQKRLQFIDNAFAEEINIQKKRHLEGIITEQEYNKKIEELTIESLNKKMAVKGQEKSQYLQYESQILDARIKQQNEGDKKLLQELTKARDQQIQMLESARNKKLEILQEAEADQKLYALRAAEIETNTAAAREAIYKEFAKTIEAAEFQNAQNRTASVEENGKQILSSEAATLKAREAMQKRFAKTTADFERLYNIKNWEQRRDEELAIIERYREENLLSEETFQASIAAVEKKYQDEKLKARQEAGLESMQEQYTAELENLARLHEMQLLSEQEFQQALLRMRLKYAAQYASEAAGYIGQMSDMVSNIMDAETANVEARYDAEIAAAGDNAAEVERLEAEKAQKKLDIEKKYADVQFAITAAQIVASTAMAVMQAFAQLGPIAGAIAGAIVAVTGVAQLLVANSQRQKVKAMTLSGSTSAEPTKTGKITMKEGFAEGGHNADMSGGGYTPSGGKYDQVGTLPVHGGEYVVASDEMMRPDVVEKVRSIERIRRRRTSKNVRGYAEGGSNTANGSISGANEAVRSDRKVMESIRKVLEDLRDGKIVVNYGITEQEAAQKRKQDIESTFTRK